MHGKNKLRGTALLWLAASLASVPSLSATTWDEPWHKTVVEDSDAFVRAALTKVTPEKVEFKVSKHLAGKEVDVGSLIGFSLLKFGSYSVEENVFDFGGRTDVYLFLNATEKPGEYKLATPTTGFAFTADGKTRATYRHSYHQAFVSDEVYEMSQIAIFKTIKKQNVDLVEARRFIKEQINKPVADIPNDIEDEEFQRFCNQHAALEMLYILGGAKLQELEPFLKHKNPHAQASAVRALGRIPKEKSKDRLLAFIGEDGRYAFAKVLAVWALRDLEAKDTKSALKKIRKTTKDEECGFGGNLMDPRIGTSFPDSVHGAIRELLKAWK